MVDRKYHPNACLSRIKNVKLGLMARTHILNTLDVHGGLSAASIGKESGLHYSVVLHHLRLLEKENIVKSKSSKPILWEATGSGQKRLDVNS